jgi:hypothetical protein
VRREWDDPPVREGSPLTATDRRAIARALRRRMRRRMRDRRPEVAGPALLQAARGSERRARRLLARAARSDDAPTRLRATSEIALASGAEAVDALLMRWSERPPDALVSVPAAVVRLIEAGSPTQAAAMVAAAFGHATPFWRARAREALARACERAGALEQAAEALHPALEDAGDDVELRQVALIHLSWIGRGIAESTRASDDASAVDARASIERAASAEREAAHALVVAMALRGPWSATAAVRLAALRTSQRRFDEAERLWSHARRLATTAGGAWEDGWIDAYACVAETGSGTWRYAGARSAALDRRPTETRPEGAERGPVGPGLRFRGLALEPATGGKARQALGLVGADDGDGALVLLTAWGTPLFVKDREIVLADVLLADVQRPAASLSEATVAALEGAEGSDALLLEPELELLLESVTARAGKDLPVPVRELLGWRRPFVYANWTVRSILNGSATDTALELRDYLARIAPGLGAVFMDVLRSPDGRPEPRAVARLIDRLWQLDDAIFAAHGGMLAATLDVARERLRPSRGVPADPTLGRAQARAAIAIDRSKCAMERRDKPYGLLDRLRNVGDAVRGLESAGAFRHDPALIDAEVLAAMLALERELPAELEQLADAAATDSYQATRRADAWRYDALINAGDLLRNVALVHAEQGDRNAALLAFSRAHRCFGLARRTEHPAVGQRVTLYRRWATCLLGAAELQAERHSARAARIADTACEVAAKVGMIPGLAAHSRAAAIAQQVIAVRLSHRLRGTDASAQIGLLLDALPPGSREISGSLNEILAACQRQDDYRGALGMIDAVAARTDDLELLGWLAHRAARIANDWARLDTEQLRTAVHRAVAQLLLQPRNATAAGDLLVLLADVDGDNVLDELERLTDAGYGETGDARSVILAFRVLTAPGPRASGDALADALVATACDESAQMPAPLALPETAEHATARVLRLIRPLALALMARGNRLSDARMVAMAGRLLEASLALRSDLGAWGAAARIALDLRHPAMARRLRALLDAEQELDPYVGVTAARLDLIAGRPAEARVLLETIDRRERGGADATQPAIIDVQARAALISGDPERARELFERIVARRPFDSRALFGLGKVALATGERIAAVDAWLRCVRSLTTAADTASRLKARMAARSIARLGADAGDVHEIDRRLAAAMLGSSGIVAATLAEGLRGGGRVRPGLAEALLQGGWNPHADSRVGQLLMATVIHDALAPQAETDPAEVMRALRRMVAWALERDVLADVLSGAKSSYSRALLERRLSDVRLPPALLLQPERGEIPPKAAAFVQHVVDSPPRGQPAYYWQARQLLSRVDVDVELAVALACAIVPSVAATMEEGERPGGLGRLLTAHVPQIALDALLASAGWVDESPARLRIGGYFDRLTLLALETTQRPVLWSATLDFCERPVDPEPLRGLEQHLARGGLELRGDGDDVRCFLRAGSAAVGLPDASAE